VLEDAIVAIPLESQDRRDEVLVAWWDGAHTVTDDQLALLGDSVRSLGLASERRAVEESRQEAQALRQSAALQREFLFRLSHELRTPLTAIRGYADSLASGDVAWGEEARRRFIERIRSESAQPARRRLLDTSAIETGGLRLNLDWCDPALLIEEAADCVGALPDDVTVDLRPDLPAVWADHDRIEQVVVNLAENAPTRDAACHSRTERR
jgi:K+-sensing histidine kinase KdpD